MTVTAFVPSQIISSKRREDRGIDLTPYTFIKQKQVRQGKQTSLDLVPSQNIHSANNNNKKKNKTKLQETTRHANENLDKNDCGKDASASTSTSTSIFNSKTQNKKKNHSFQYYGNLPDVHWRAIPMEHLRVHPKYKPLPLPTTLESLQNIEQVRQFRQDSWQWDALHTGRCTTSQSAPALGFLEPKAAKLLGIPRSLQKSPMQAFKRLSQKALRSLEEMNAVLCHYENDDDYYQVECEHYMLWRDMKDVKHYPFSSKYLPFISKADLEIRKEDTQAYMQNLSSSMRVRMSWGNSQEATAILTALNYFTKLDPDVILEEVGMCGAGLALNCTEGDEHALILGASPDSIITYGNGTSEVLEVKNHCPFVPSDWMSGSKKQKQRRKSKGGFRIRELPLQYSVPPAYIPQLMMEILCCGESCRSAIMVRQTATCGAVILRLHRDDEWISEMIYWLKMFMSEYVSKETPPPQNFFFDGHEESERYQRFLERTKALSESVEFVKEVRHNDIQRVLGENGLRLPLFLDNFGYRHSR